MPLTEKDFTFETLDELEEARDQKKPDSDNKESNPDNNDTKEAPNTEASLGILRDTQKSRKKSSKSRPSEDKTAEEKRDKRIQKIAIIAIGVVIIAALIPLIMMKVGDIRENMAIKASIAQAESIAEYESSVAQSEYEELLKEESQRKLTKTEIPEINMLVTDYFDARLRADSSKMLSLYGRVDQSVDEEWTAKLTAQASWVKGFENIAVYDMEGTRESERFCIVTYEVDFRRTNINAPGIMYFFAEKTDSGYIIEENLLSDEHSFLERQLKRTDVRNLIDETDRRLKEKLDDNSTLALIYTSFINGEIYKEPDLDFSAEQQVDLFTDPEDSILIDQ